jgi:UDP:flavonoid glycosyltransferase YjiC (YdhE family)
MLTILFDIFPATGHYNATFKLAKLLKQRGHRIVYIGPQNFYDKITSLGFEFHIISPHILEPDIAEHGLITFFMERFLESFSRTKYESVALRIKEYDDLITKYFPDLLVLDDHYIYKAVFYYKYKIKIIAVQSMTAKERDNWIPPFQSTVIPKLRFDYKILINCLWLIRLLKNRKGLFVNRALAFGQDTLSMAKKFALDYGFSFHENINYNLSLGIGFRNIPVFKLTPRDFDFPRQPIWNHYYVGPLVDREREKVIADLRYLEVIQKLIKSKKEDKDVSIIYSSLGTVTDREMKWCDIFFKRIVEVCSANPNYKLILSVGKYYNVSRLLPKPVNLYIFQHVPQIHLLSHADLMINHGGVNSISECVFAGVPMLAFPLSPHWDQNGCAARIVYHDLGLRGNIKGDCAATISRKIDFIFKNYDRYKRSLFKMRAKFDILNNSTGAAGIIEDIAKDI